MIILDKFIPCAHCGDGATDFSKKRVVWECPECKAELEFGVIPKVTGPSKDTPAGRGGLDGESPWQSNTIREYEDRFDA